jgi:hypothetical protein
VFEIRRVDQFENRIAEQIRVLAIVEPEGHFVQVGREMRNGKNPLHEIREGVLFVRGNRDAQYDSAVTSTSKRDSSCVRWA